jgi:hypothetical protein
VRLLWPDPHNTGQRQKKAHAHQISSEKGPYTDRKNPKKGRERKKKIQKEE